MAPAQSKLAASLATGPSTSTQRKRKASSKITDDNFEGAETNAVTKRLKLSADMARAASAKRHQRQPSVEDVDDEDSVSANSSPKNPNTLLEAVDGSDDIEMLDNPTPGLEDVEEDDDDEGEDEPEVSKPIETAEAQRGKSVKIGNQTLTHRFSPLERLSDDWVSPIYAFFQRTPSIVNVDGRRVHEFKCTASNCKGCGKNPRIVRRYLDTSDRNSTGNLRKHARLCWGDEILGSADACGDLESARQGLDHAKMLKDGSITAAFERKGKGKVMYSHCQHNKAQTRSVAIDNYLPNLTRVSGPKSSVGYRKACDPFLLLAIEDSNA